MQFKNLKFKIKNFKKGFTVIEMIIVTAIFGILTTVIMFNYGDFTDNILSTNMAYEVALDARKAQAFGLGVRGVGGEFESAYGIYINLSDGSDENGTKNVIFFSDSLPVGGNGKCNGIGGQGFCTCTSSGNQTDECITQRILQRNIIIDSVKVGPSCAVTNNLAVTFKRPNPDAMIVDQEHSLSNFEFAEIRLNSSRSDRPRYVIIRNTGQISVDQTSLCDSADE